MFWKAGSIMPDNARHRNGGLLIAMINGLLRQRGLKLEHIAGLKQEVVEFCRRSLVKNKFGHR